jgi:hypothetical protein
MHVHCILCIALCVCAALKVTAKDGTHVCRSIHLSKISRGLVGTAAIAASCEAVLWSQLLCCRCTAAAVIDSFAACCNVCDQAANMGHTHNRWYLI